MASQTGQQITAIYKLSNISRSKGNQEMKFSQLIKYSVENIFLKNYVENEVWRFILDLFSVFKKVLYKVNASVQHLSFNIFL